MAKLGSGNNSPLQPNIKIKESELIVIEKPVFTIHSVDIVVDKPSFSVSDNVEFIEKPVFQVQEHIEQIHVKVPQYELGEFDASIQQINLKIQEINEKIPQLPTVEIKYKAPTSLIVGLSLSLLVNIGAAALWLLV